MSCFAHSLWSRAASPRTPRTPLSQTPNSALCVWTRCHVVLCCQLTSLESGGSTRSEWKTATSARATVCGKALSMAQEHHSECKASQFSSFSRARRLYTCILRASCTYYTYCLCRLLAQYKCACLLAIHKSRCNPDARALGVSLPSLAP